MPASKQLLEGRAAGKLRRQHLDANPALVEGLASGKIKVSHQLVKAKADGTVTVQEIVLNPNALDLGLGK